MTDAFRSASSSATQPRSPRTIAVDNFLRRALRIGDPHDPTQVAAALLNRYPEEADRESRERSGLPYSTIPLQPAAAAGGIAALAELAQAQDDLDRDSQALINASELKDIRVELTGWGRSIRKIAEDGLAAARIALDSSRYDQALTARGQLISYARLARYVGALSCGAAVHFRRLAQSCDIFAGLILVGIGEGLAASGITRGTALLRVGGGELQARRNAVIIALRSLTGSVDAALGQEDWPRGMEAYRRLVAQLDESGQSELRTLLEEQALSLAMDELVDLSAGANVNGLRELATTSAMLVDRFQRLIRLSQSLATSGSAESPPLVTFTSALQLFVDAFASPGGNRLLYVARPPIIIYGLYGSAGADKGARRLIELTVLRGRLLELIDCFACCKCDDDGVRCQVLLDFLLFTLDRAIDAYAVGTNIDGNGEPERRVAAFGLLFKQALDLADKTLAPADGEPADGAPAVCKLDDTLRGALVEIGNELRKPVGPGPYTEYPLLVQLMGQELRMAYHAEAQVERLVRGLSPACYVAGLFDLRVDGNDPESLVRVLIQRTLGYVDPHHGVDLPDTVRVPPTVATSLADLAYDYSHPPSPPIGPH
jgi:hypothetical protein